MRSTLGFSFKCCRKKRSSQLGRQRPEGPDLVANDFHNKVSAVIIAGSMTTYRWNDTEIETLLARQDAPQIVPW